MLVTAMKIPHLLPPQASRVTDTRCKRFPHVYTHTLARTHAPPYATTFPQGSSRAGGCERASKRIARTRKKILAKRLHTRTRSNTSIYTRAANAVAVVVCGVWCGVLSSMSTSLSSSSSSSFSSSSSSCYNTTVLPIYHKYRRST